jgi:hypothetical protein
VNTSARSEPVLDRAGQVLGRIEYLAGGDQVLRDTNGDVRGYYDARGDLTRGPDERILAKGNKLRSLIC